MRNQGFVLWEVLFSMALLLLVFGVFSEGFLNWKLMDNQSSELGKAVFLGQQAMEEYFQNGEEISKNKEGRGFKVDTIVEEKGDLFWVAIRVEREEIEWEKKIEFVTLYSPDCLLRGGK